MRTARPFFLCALAAGIVAALGSATASAACPNEALRVGPSAALPECRAYEQVSPVDKNGSSVQQFLRLGSDGESASWIGLGAYADTAGSNAEVPYAAHRTTAGWVTTAFSPRYDAGVRSDLLSNGGGYLFPDDLSSMTFISHGGFSPEDDDNYPGVPFGPTDVYRVGPGGSSTLLSHGEGVVANGFGAAALVGTSGDGTSVFFRTAEPLSPDVTSTETQLWRWRDGQVQAVAENPGGGLLEGESWLGAGNSYVEIGTADGGQAPDSTAVSADGSRFVYSGSALPGGSRQVYLHQDGAPSRQLSLSQRTGSVGEPSVANAVFIAASADLGTVYFQSDDQLTDDAPAGGGLYVYDVAGGGLRFSNPDNSPSVSPSEFGREGLVRVSEDGSHVYFVSPLALAPGAVAGDRNLYVQTGGIRRLIGILSESDLTVAVSARAEAQAFYPAYTDSSLSLDGTKLVFASRAALAGAQPNGHTEIYLYDAAADSLRCVSCRPGGEPSQGDASLRVTTNDYRLPVPRAISADARTVAFTTSDRLLPEDSNGIDDVYGYRDGALFLISSGSSGSRSIGTGLSQDGADAYFITAQSLAPSDIDGGLRDLYDARVNGGFPTAGPAAACAGDECQGLAAPPPEYGPPASAVVAGASNRKVRKGRTCAKGRKTVRAKGKVRCVSKRSIRRQGR